MSGTDAVIPVFPAGYSPQPSDFDTWVQAPLQFLTTRVVFRAEYHGTTSLTGGSNTLIPFDTILEDPYSGWNAATHQWLCPAGCSGWYELTMTATAGNAGVTTSTVEPLAGYDGAPVSGAAGEWAADGQAGASSGSYILPLIAGFDTLSMYIYTDVTVNTPATAGQYPCIEIVWISE